MLAYAALGFRGGTGQRRYRAAQGRERQGRAAPCQQRDDEVREQIQHDVPPPDQRRYQLRSERSRQAKPHHALPRLNRRVDRLAMRAEPREAVVRSQAYSTGDGRRVFGVRCLPVVAATVATVHLVGLQYLDDVHLAAVAQHICNSGRADRIGSIQQTAPQRNVYSHTFDIDFTLWAAAAA